MRKYIGNEVAKEYRTKYGMEMPTMRLAKKLWKENRTIFRTVDNARSALRYIEGKMGGRMKKFAEKTIHFVEKERPRNPYNLPESDEKEFIPYQLKAKRIALLSDIHVPYHSIGAITVALDFIKKEKPDVVLINGDLFDMYKLSRFCIDPRKRDFAQEIKMGCDLLEIISKITKARIIFKGGNHDSRLEKYIYQRADALAGFEDFELKTIVTKRLPDVEVLSDRVIISANELSIIHGHEFGMSVFSPVNIARGLYLKGKANAICGHHHRPSSHNERTMQGKMIATWSTGCLCELNPEYLPINNWSHGFAMIDMGEETGFEVRNYSIYKGKVC